MTQTVPTMQTPVPSTGQGQRAAASPLPGPAGRWMQRVQAGARHAPTLGRLARFALVGGLSGTVQLGLIAQLTRAGLRPFLAEVAAFLAAAQVNFALSQWFTWRDRIVGGAALGKRWLAFHTMIAGTALLNFLVFLVADRVLPHLLAAALGIAAAGLINFVGGDRLVFARLAPAPVRVSARRSLPMKGGRR